MLGLWKFSKFWIANLTPMLYFFRLLTIFKWFSIPKNTLLPSFMKIYWILKKLKPKSETSLSGPSVFSTGSLVPRWKVAMLKPNNSYDFFWKSNFSDVQMSASKALRNNSFELHARPLIDSVSNTRHRTFSLSYFAASSG